MSIPDVVSESRSGATDVRVTVMPIDPPGLEYSIRIAFMTWPTNMVSDLIVPLLLQRFANPCGNGVQCLIPRNAFPLSATSFSFSLQRIEYPLWIGDLVDGSWPFGTVPSSTPWVIWIPFELPDASALLVHIGGQAASAFTVETSGRYNGVCLLFLLRPGRSLILLPVIPLFHGRELVQVRLSHPVEHWLTFLMEVWNDADFLG
jgi:hypothetical protein